VIEHRLVIGDRPVTLLEGPAGWGECSPLAGYPCDPGAARRAAEEAAVEGWPAPVRDAVPVNALVDDGERLAGSLIDFPCVKVKVGADPGSAADRVAAVRDLVGPAVAVRVDANGAWDVDTAAAVIGALAPYDIEYVEQPVATIEELAELRRRVAVPLAADECVRSLADARRIVALDAADVLVLKVQPLGGVRAALDVAAATALPAVVTSMRETSVGLAAGLALAAALPELRFACGLATEPLGDVVRDPLRPEGGVLRLRRPEPDPELLDAYRVVRT
jgi:O-succinylbenzoate synthase